MQSQDLASQWHKFHILKFVSLQVLMLSVAMDTASAALPLPHSPVHGYSPVTPAYNHHQAPNHHLYAMTPAYPAYGYRREILKHSNGTWNLNADILHIHMQSPSTHNHSLERDSNESPAFTQVPAATATTRPRPRRLRSRTRSRSRSTVRHRRARRTRPRWVRRGAWWTGSTRRTTCSTPSSTTTRRWRHSTRRGSDTRSPSDFRNCIQAG